MTLPFGEIKENRLEMKFSSADFTIASVLGAIREHLDMLGEMGIVFLGASTEIPPGPSPVFKPVAIKAIFEYTGGGSAQKFLQRAYEILWEGVVSTFPAEEEWALSKSAYAEFIRAQADLLRARIEDSSTE